MGALLYAQHVALGTNRTQAIFRRTLEVNGAPDDLVSNQFVSGMSQTISLNKAHIHPYPGTKLPPAFHFEQLLK